MQNSTLETFMGGHLPATRELEEGGMSQMDETL